MYGKRIDTIDGRIISDRIASATDYFEQVLEMNEEDIERIFENNIELYETTSKIISLLYSHKLLRNTSHICGSLCESIIQMISELKQVLREKYNIEFDVDLFDYY